MPSTGGARATAGRCANWLILRGRHAITDLVRSQGRLTRDGRERPGDVLLADDPDGRPGVENARTAPSAESEFFRRWDARQAENAIARLDARDRRLGYVARYLYEDRGSQRALAKQLGISAPRVSQLVDQARRHLVPVRELVG